MYRVVCGFGTPTITQVPVIPDRINNTVYKLHAHSMAEAKAFAMNFYANKISQLETEIAWNREQYDYVKTWND